MTELPRLPQRLGKMLRERTGLSLTSLQAFERQGRISLARPTPAGLRELTFDEDAVMLDNEPLPPKPESRYFALNKPLGIVTTVRAPDGEADLQPWLRSLSPPVFPVGRLDRDSSGLLLLTNDGDLGYALMSPEHHVEKEYRVTLRGEVNDADPRLLQLLQPMIIDQVTMTLSRVTLLLSHRDNSALSVILKEGKHRQIRKMCRKVGLCLTGLHRERIGPVRLLALPVGGCRSLTDDEVQGLWQAAGGRHYVRERQLLALARLAVESRRANVPHARLELWLEEHLPHFCVRKRQEQPFAEG